MSFVFENPVKWTLVLAAGVWMLFFQSHFSAWLRSRHQDRLADRHARGRDAYFEELRALEAYPPERRSPMFDRVVGGLLIGLAISPVVVELTH